MASRGFKSTAEALLQDFGIDLAAAGIKHLSNETNVNRALALIETAKRKPPTMARGIAAWQRETAPRPDRYAPKLTFGFERDDARQAKAAAALARKKARNAGDLRRKRERKRAAGLLAPMTEHGAKIAAGMAANKSMSIEERRDHQRRRARERTATYRERKKAKAAAF
jgi:hypothetical protein